MVDKFTPGEWRTGFDLGVWGPTCPSIRGATVGENLDRVREQGAERYQKESLPITVRDLDDGKSCSCIAILPYRSGKSEQRANARLIVAAPRMLAGLKQAREDICKNLCALDIELEPHCQACRELGTLIEEVETGKEDQE